MNYLRLPSATPHFRKPPHVDLIQSRNSGRTAYLHNKMAVFQLAVQHLQESVSRLRERMGIDRT